MNGKVIVYYFGSLLDSMLASLGSLLHHFDPPKKTQLGMPRESSEKEVAKQIRISQKFQANGSRIGLMSKRTAAIL